MRALSAGNPVGGDAGLRAARSLNRAAGVIAASVLVDSAIEHYRGSFHNKGMIAPLVSAGLALAVSVHGHADRRKTAHRFRNWVYIGAGLTGLAGTLFHAFNITKKPGGICWQNLFYAAPIGAPGALILSGTMGHLAERVRDTPPDMPPRVLGVPAARLVAGVTGAGLLGAAGETALLHFRGAYHDPFMFLPVTIPPAAALLIGDVAIGRAQPASRLTRSLLRLTAALGMIGAGFHVRGVARSMGGWRNWRQNVPNGPPIPAPPSFTGLALAGLAALALRESYPNE